ncbi:MAG: hypothetical protein JKY15_05000 [Deltaproteobacteria bacterium]|nr:hypothetical protein [Deltaproteobacteria bacterium]
MLRSILYPTIMILLMLSPVSIADSNKENGDNQSSTVFIIVKTTIEYAAYVVGGVSVVTVLLVGIGALDSYNLNQQVIRQLLGHIPAP